MKKEQREVYRALAAEIDWSLCSFCKFAEGGGFCGEMECRHPLEIISGDVMVYDPYDDCWGYRPVLSVADIADIVGIVLDKGWKSASYTHSVSRTGPILVVGE